MTAIDATAAEPHARAAAELAVSTTTFGSLEIDYDTRVLKPRAWTAMQSRWAVELLADAAEAPALLEMCTGAGHIGLLAAAESGGQLIAVDVDPVACAFALGNAKRAGLLDRVEVRCADIEEAIGVGEMFSVVVADPPWLPSARVEDYPEEPVLANDGGVDGLDLARRCVRVAQRHLTSAGTLLLQLGDAVQCDAVAREASPGLRETGRRRGEGGWVLALTRAGYAV